jgi:hypothetical protein
MDGLTEGERKRVLRHMATMAPGHALAGLVADVEAILAARLSLVEAERDEARRVQYLAEQDRDDHAAREAEAEVDENTALLQFEVAEQELDEARANRDRLAHENAALRQQVADLQESNVARAEVIARVRASLVHTDPSQIGSSRSAWLDGEAAMASRVRAALDGPAPQPDEEACQMHGPGSVATPNADGVYEHGCTCPESDEPDCTCTHYIVDHSDPEPYHPENLDREDDPSCPIHGTPPTTDADGVEG